MTVTEHVPVPSPNIGPFGNVQVFQPFPETTAVVFARAASRSRAFAAIDGVTATVLVGAAAGPNPDHVVPRARGELLERVSNVLAGRRAERDGKWIATYAELHRAGTPALDPAAWRDVAPSSAYIRDVPMLWAGGQSLVTGHDVLVPACAAFLRHRPPAGCGAILGAGSAGTAAHVSREVAIEHAVLEVLERDLISRSWYGSRSATPLGANPPAAVSGVLGDLGLELTGLRLDGPGATVCVVACVHAPGGDQQSFGARCTVSGIDGALEAATFEALMVRWSLGTPEARRAWERLRQTGPSTLPYGAVEHALWAYHRQDSLTHWLGAGTGATDTAPAGSATTGDVAEVIAAHTGEDVVLVDSTAPIAAREGVTVVRVVAPGAGRLPGDERTAPGYGRGALPHPFG